MNFTPLVRPFFVRRAHATRAWADLEGIERVQRNQLQRLLKAARATAVGRRHGFGYINSYEEFAARVPIVEYEDIRADVMAMVEGRADVLWPGVTKHFAQSSGTSGGKSKYIPVTGRGLKHNHFAGSADVVAFYLNLNPESRIFAGRSFILGGSFANELADVPPGVTVGDLSANLIDSMPGPAALFRVPAKDIALMADWNRKLPALIEASLKADITNISGVPSWFMTVLQGVIERAGATTIHDVWPNLEVFFHGGIAFGPYREQYRAMTDPSKMHYLETYNASEGFFAVQDTLEPGSMRLLVDRDVFFEFLPLGGDTPVPAWEVRQGHTYALIITSSNGLWRYSLGDTVRIESLEPLRISIAGRTSAFINAFGEELMVWNADKAIAHACAATDASPANYTAAPVFAGCGTKGHHQWLIEWNRPPRGGMENFAAVLDAELQRLNSDYQAKRAGGIFLAPPELVSVPLGTFNRWLASTGKLGGQRKIPRLCNNRRIADAILALINN